MLAQSGLMKWCDTPYSYLALTKPSEYSDESRLEVRPAHAKYLFVYPFVKTREWYRLAPDERWKIMQEHIKVGREYPQIDLNTSYSFGLDDQEFVVAFETDEPAAFLDLVQRLRTTEASALHQARHADVHVRGVLGRARAERARRRAADRRGPGVTTDLRADFDEIRDITVIGAGPVGLTTAFWAGMRQASARIIDSLPEIGGQCTTLYPEKWVFDVPGHPRVLAKDLVGLLRAQSLEQFDVPVHLETTAEAISWERRLRRPAHRPRRPALAHGDRRRRPRRLRAEEAAAVRRRHGAVGGPRRALHRRREGGLLRQARGDRRRRRLGVRLGRQPRRHRRRA